MNRLLRPLTLISLFALLFFPAGQLALAHEEHPHMHAEIDIKPGSYPNSINIRSNGKVPVALFGSDMFAVTSVDIASVRLHPMDRPEGGAPVNKFAYTDLNSDGYLDIIFHFRTQAIGLQPGDEMACLHGMTMTGDHFCGHDTVRVID